MSTAIIRVIGGLAISVFTLAGIPGPVAVADDGARSPGTPIIRVTERGSGMSGVGVARPGTQLEDAHRHRVVVAGGSQSAGAPIMVVRGNPAGLPLIQVDDVVVCSARQRVSSKMIQCSR